jgi:gluconokinase
MGQIVVMMGVSGVGKTTVGRLVARRLGVPFLDADDFHEAASISRMRAGLPLDSELRLPWLDRVNQALRAEAAAGAVVACSALTEEYRARLTADLDDVAFVLLTGPPLLLHDRLEQRAGHYAGASLLASQLEILSSPADAIVEDVRDPADVVAERVVAALARR